MKKKILTIALAGLMAASLAACGGSKTTETKANESSQASESVADSKAEGSADASLVELGKMIEPQLTKSGVNHRLRKLSSIADSLREQVRREDG